MKFYVVDSGYIAPEEQLILKRTLTVPEFAEITLKLVRITQKFSADFMCSVQQGHSSLSSTKETTQTAK